RRHTRCLSDWSSDVCSSDLRAASPPGPGGAEELAAAVQSLHDDAGTLARLLDAGGAPAVLIVDDLDRLFTRGRREDVAPFIANRSEERRVGKGRRDQRSAVR